MAGYVTGPANRLASDGAWNYFYDGEGNTTKRINISTGQTWTYGFDLNNRLLWVELRISDGGTLQTRAEYGYDAWAGGSLTR
jgi:hypothetical protein